MHKYLTTAPLLLGLAVALPMATVPTGPAHAQIGIGIGIGISVHIAPPVLPVYVQPPLPAPGYLWTPGYWAYGDAGYYWVPGTWVEPPSVGLLWTPPWWGFAGGVYGFHAGYWGPHVGFYGGINYGFGYNGSGFFGGRWGNGGFEYNQAYNNFGGTHITNVYNERVNNDTTITRTSFNGQGGINARPTPEQEAAEHENHVQPTPAQSQHFDAARTNPDLRASVNHGNPAIAATARPGAFNGEGVMAARGAPAAQVAAVHATPAGRAAAGAEPGRPGGEAARPGEPGRPAGQAARPGEPRAPNAQVAHAPGAPHPTVLRAAPRPAAQHAAPRAAPRPAPHPQAARPAPHPQARPAPHPQARPAPRPAAHAAPHPQEKHR
jgi:hypothetical protein